MDAQAAARAADRATIALHGPARAVTNFELDCYGPEACQRSCVVCWMPQHVRAPSTHPHGGAQTSCLVVYLEFMCYERTACSCVQPTAPRSGYGYAAAARPQWMSMSKVVISDQRSANQ